MMDGIEFVVTGFIKCFLLVCSEMDLSNFLTFYLNMELTQKGF